MPISSFGEGLRNAIMFMPGTYGTSLLRNHTLRGAMAELSKNYSADAIKGLKDSIDCNIYFFGKQVQTSTMYLITIATVILLVGIYVLINVLRKDKNK